MFRSAYSTATYNNAERLLPPTYQCPKTKIKYFDYSEEV